MSPENHPHKPLVPTPWQPRFGTRAMLLLMLVTSVMGAGGYYFVRSFQGGRPFQLVFILFTLAAPMLIMVIVSVMYAVLGTKQKPPRKR